MKKINRRILRRLIIETTKPTIDQVRAAQEELGTRDLSRISTYLGAHEDEVAEMLAGDRPGRTHNPFSTPEASPTPFEYVLADVIARAWEEHTLEQPNQPSDPSTWYKEVDEAAGRLEDAIMDSGMLNDLFKLIHDIEEELHDGQFHPDQGSPHGIPR